MCFDRLTDEGVTETSIRDLLVSELRWSFRIGSLAGGMVLAVLLFEGAPAWLVAASVAGAVALGSLLHLCVLVAGALVQRGRARVRESGVARSAESA